MSRRGGRRRAALIGVPLVGLFLLWALSVLPAGERGPQVVQLSSQGALSPEPVFPVKENTKGFSADSHRVVHLDLKGGPPRLDYLKRLLPLLAEQGCTALLIEYEDMFPFTDSLRNISARNAYTRQEVRKLLSWAHDLGLEVIPLVQTFGHLEYVLKLEEFTDLRELADCPGELCPSKPKSLQLVEEIVSQVMGLHKGARYIHLGADEVFHIAACGLCSRSQPRELYSRHVTAVVEMVHRKYPGVTAIIWDDMMRSWVPGFLSASPLASLVEPMVWAYGPEVTSLIPHYVWYWYTKTFKRVWVAGVFKGASSPVADLPDIQSHYSNAKSWLKMITDAQVTIAGFVLTGWSRYDHFMVLCELLPASVPSLLLGLTVISRTGVHLKEEQYWPAWRRALRCSPSDRFTLHTLKEDQRQLSTCAFPGAEVYSAVLHLADLKRKTDELYLTLTEKKGSMTRYNVRHNFSNPWRVVEDYTSLKTYPLLQEIRRYADSTRRLLLEVFDKDVTEEWIEQRVTPMEEKLVEVGRTLEKLINRNVWPRRPLKRTSRGT